MARPLVLPLVLDRAADASLSSQVAGQIRDGVVAGTLPVGARLPSSRALARDLGISRAVTEQAFDQLTAEGWTEGRHGSGTFVAAVGADSPDKQELDPEIMGSATVFTDITEQCAHVGELHHALDRGIVTVANVKAELGDLISGRSSGRSSHDEITIFDSTGTALQDAAAAALTYEKAIASGRGTMMDFFR